MPAVVDLLLPPRCASCHAPRATGLCARCTDEAGDLVAEDLAPVRLAAGVVAVAAFRYDGPVAAAVRTVKRPGRHAAAPGLGRLLWQVVGGHLDIAGSARTWVPATPAARRRRGVEVPRLLAGPAAVSMLAAVGDRPDQTTLDAAGRRRNVRDAFRAVRPVPDTVVCVDDVRTTGATLQAAAAALQAAGARRVLGVTFAVAEGEGLAPSPPGPSAQGSEGAAPVP